MFTDIWLVVKYTFLGLFQGFTEPIPISSSGHLVLLQNILNMNIEGLSFEILVNFGSLLAILIIYRKDIERLIQNGIRYIIHKEPEARADFNFIFYLIIGTIPAGVIGLLLEDWIGETFGFSKMVGVTLIITGIALWIIRNINGEKNDAEITWKDALIVGLAQSVALIPGISRSGATIVAAMLIGMKKATALRFSFLLFIPVSLGTMMLSIDDLIEDPDFAMLALPYVFALFAALIATYYSLRWFMNIMERGNLKYFSYYCFVVGALAILML